MQDEVWICSMDPPTEDAQDRDMLILLTSTVYVIVNFQQDRGKTLKEHISKELVPRGFYAIIEEIQEDQHQW